MGKNMEVELKLQLLNTDVGAALPRSTWLRSLLQAGSVTTTHMEAVYYDTPSRLLWKGGFAFRIRKEGERWVATLKGAGQAAGGLHQRREWNAEVDGSVVKREVFCRMPGAEAVVKLLAGQDEELEPLFQTSFSRWSGLVHPAGSDAVIEMALDKGVITAAEKSEVIAEVELELKAGTAAQLLAFGAVLAKRYPLLPEWRSKYYRGLQLAGLPATEEALSAGRQDSPGTLLAAGLCEVLAEQSDYWRHPAAIESLHDLRVALRRLRSKLSLAAPLWPAEQVQGWQEALRGWSRRMAELRELDVLQDEWAGTVQSGGITLEHSCLQQRFALRRQELARGLEQQISSGKLTADLLALWAWTAAADGAMARDEWRTFARRRLTRWLKAVRRETKTIAATDGEQLHQLRIRTKKCRYLVEACCPGDDAATRRLLETLKQLQDCLGEIHDAGQGAGLIRKLERVKAAGDICLESAYFLGWQARREYDARRELPACIKAVRRALKRWLRKSE